MSVILEKQDFSRGAVMTPSGPALGCDTAGPCSAEPRLTKILTVVIME